ncbi:carboxylesterase family protein [Stachybotrys elegans]|uniref:Carboxylic ester hydrolase n=1 Tax=Stachybotrys elegans TaxID=80388 RepID=A0A8K0SRP4_9HYPO|nr:carboxylesterase family protein [Stachybotrys elegans]
MVSGIQRLGELAVTALSLASVTTASPALQQRSAVQVPVVSLKNGSYSGIHLPEYGQDNFLGMPYAKPPVGDLRFRVPQPLDSTWDGVREATEYSPFCIGYGSDTWVLGNHVSEDCLTINVVRPAGVSAEDSLPVAFWVHGGGFTNGGSGDPRYNLSFIVEQSVQMGTPIVAASINYRLQSWGFLHGNEIVEEGSTNIAFRDQRLALHWVQENIASFGGNPDEVTLWGESAGARSVGVQLIAYDGRDDHLFKRAVMQSASPAPATPQPFTANDWEPYYQAVLSAAGCSPDNQTETNGLDCLRTVPVDDLSAIFNSTLKAKIPGLGQVVDGDLVTAPGDDLMREHKFVKVPLLMGTNFDEGAEYATQGINTDEQFLQLIANNGIDKVAAARIAELYPDDPDVGIPATLPGRPSGDIAFLGSQWKRVAAYRGDTQQHGPRRFTTRMWAEAGVPAYSYHFNVRPHGIAYWFGAKHFVEVVFVFNNVDGLGYENAVSENPMEGKPAKFLEIADKMSKMWVSFFVTGDPNWNPRACSKWPQYTLDAPANIVFDANTTKTAFIEPDTYRQEEIDYLIDLLN